MSSDEESKPARDFDVSNGAFRLNLGHILLLLGLAFSWWDGRAQEQKAMAVEAARSEYTRSILDDMRRLQNLQQYDINTIKMALAENGIKVKGGS